MRNFYEESFSAGFDYAYTYPAMAKAVQAAGRVIRSERDRGLIVLMDDRFLHPSYVKSMPSGWFKEPREAVSNKILQEVAEFWGA
jgi:DNA excision repair protein ERCC-2